MWMNCWLVHKWEGDGQGRIVGWFTSGREVDREGLLAGSQVGGRWTGEDCWLVHKWEGGEQGRIVGWFTSGREVDRGGLLTGSKVGGRWTGEDC